MTAENLIVKNKIIEAAIECIEKEGIHNLSVRKICFAAGVNVASINYYFGSKEELLNEALKLTLRNGFDDLLIELNSVEQEPEQLFSYLLNFLLAGAMRWPGITKAHFYKPWNNNYDSLFVEKFYSFLEGLLVKFKPFYPLKTDEEIKTLIVQIISAVMFPAVMPKLFSPFCQLDFNNEADRGKYIDNLLVNFKIRVV